MDSCESLLLTYFTNIWPPIKSFRNQVYLVKYRERALLYWCQISYLPIFFILWSHRELQNKVFKKIIENLKVAMWVTISFDLNVFLLIHSNKFWGPTIFKDSKKSNSFEKKKLITMFSFEYLDRCRLNDINCEINSNIT